MISGIGRLVNGALALVGLRLGRVPSPSLVKQVDVPKRKSLSWPPVANFDNVALVLEYFTTARPGAVFVQVGANDGETSDSVNSFVKRGVLRSVLVEPIRENFVKLEKFYAGTPGVQLVEAAIGHQCGTETIYGVRDSGRWAGSAWASQLASFDRDHLLRSGIEAAEIEERTVQTLDLQTLMERSGVERIDVLQIDVEGFDAEIVRMALAMPVPPACICFEFVQFVKHMDQNATNAFYAELTSKGYSWSHDRINTMAIHEDFVRTGTPEMKGA